MAATVLMILKIIGIVLLIILGILLLHALIVLFWPIRYEVNADIREPSPDNPEEPLFARVTARASFSWILRLIRGVYNYPGEGENKRGGSVTFAFIKLYPRENKPKRRKRRRRRRPGEDTAGRKEQSVQQAPSAQDGHEAEAHGKAESPREESARLNRSEASSDTAGETGRVETGGSDAVSGEGTAGEAAGRAGSRKRRGKRRRWMSPAHRIRVFKQRLINLFTKPELAAKKTGYTISGFCDRVRKVRAWSQSQSLSRAKQLLLNEARRVFRHLIPRKCRVVLRYGTSDPKLTADIYGFICACYPVLGDHVEIVPVFDESTLSGTVRIRGRAILFVLLFAFLRCYLNRDVRKSKARWDAIRDNGEDEDNG